MVESFLLTATSIKLTGLKNFPRAVRFAIRIRAVDIKHSMV